MEIRHNLEKHLREVVRERDPYLATGGHFYVREYIRQELRQFGQVETQEFKIKGRSHYNLILDLPARSNIALKPPILIIAHYDTVPGSPGADDNGTGIAVLLELARVFSSNTAQFPLRLVAVDLEEYGLLGSKAYAGFLQQQKQSLRLVISLEMLGYCDNTPNSQLYPPLLKYFYPSEGNFIALISNFHTMFDTINMAKNIKKTSIPCEWLVAPLRGFLVPDTRRSDHAPFWDCGYKAIMVTDTANLRNPHYHKPSDTLATINLDFLTGVCEGLIEAIENIS